VIEQLWRAIDDGATNVKPGAAKGLRADAAKQPHRLGPARATCNRCGESVALPSATPVTMRTASTNTTATFHENHGGKSRGRTVQHATKATQCTTVGDVDGSPDAFALSAITPGSPTAAALAARFGSRAQLVPLGDPTDAATQTAGWLDADDDYAQALAAPDALRLSRHTLRYHRRHYGKMNRRRDGSPMLRGPHGAHDAIEPRRHRDGSSSSSDSDLDVGLQALRELDGLGMHTTRDDAPQGGGRRHFANGVWGSIPRRHDHRLATVAGGGAVPPSGAASSSALEDYASVLSSAHPVSWEQERLPGQGAGNAAFAGALSALGPAGAAAGSRPGTGAPHPRLTTPPLGAARRGVSQHPYRQAPSRQGSAAPARAATPGPLPRAGRPERGPDLRPGSVGLGGRSANAPGSRPPSGAAVAAVKSRLLAS